VDYDRTPMPEAYDRGRALAPGVLALWLDEMASLLPRRPERIVDLGSGTGRFSFGLADGYAAQVIGVDPSEKMLSQARAKPAHSEVSFRTGSAEQIPIESGWADLVFMSMVFHHIGERATAAAECARVLAPGGCVAIRNPTRDGGLHNPLGGWFEGFEAIYEAQMPLLAEVTAPFEAAGFHRLGHRTIRQQTHPDWGRFVEQVSHRADSLLIRLPDAAFQAGLDRLRANPQPGPVYDEVALIVLQRP
jgi:ubiquinone/menaquinone biosynthesis C-methylase UbiE